MSARRLRDRLAQANPLAIDAIVAIGLAVAVCAQLWAYAHIQPPHGMPIPPGGAIREHRRQLVDFATYLLACAVFLPLALRRRLPWLAFALSASAAATYLAMPFPPAFVMLGPMIAIYEVAVASSKRRTILIALLLLGLVGAVLVFAFSPSVRWALEAAGSFTMLIAAALLGDGSRSRRAYVAEVEQRALDAERTREEEALRRVEEERLTIAREVHDIIAHSLSIVTIQAAAAEAVIDSDPEQARESLKNIRTTGREALAELRSMLDVLRTGDADTPLTPSSDLSSLAQLTAPLRDAGIAVRAVVEGDIAGVPAYASVSAYRIIQEALTNVMRHANAGSVDIALTARPDELRLSVHDDGRSADQVPATAGHGIEGMAERVSALGGEFSTGSSSDGGFLVSAVIPLGRSKS